MIGKKCPKNLLGALALIWCLTGVCCCAYKNQTSVFSEFLFGLWGLK
jgi:hypothetical protein